MITLDEAIKVAKDHNINFDSWEEYKDLYVFYDTKKELSFGGFGGSIVVLKDTGDQRAFSPWAVKYPESLNKKLFIKEGTC